MYVHSIHEKQQKMEAVEGMIQSTFPENLPLDSSKA
jgi:hypothetical protein